MVIITRPETTEQIVRECGDVGVRRVWMHQSIGKGSSVSAAAVEYCRRQGISVIAGASPDDVRRRRRLRPHLHAVDALAHRRTAEVMSIDSYRFLDFATLRRMNAYSLRRTSTGLTRSARRSGMELAATATPISSETAAMITAGSTGLVS